MTWEKKKYGININGKRLINLHFADDVVVFAKSAKELEAMLTELNTQSQEMGLEMNPTKTKILSNSDYVPVTVNGALIQYYLDYTYLGQTVSMIENGYSEIRRRVGLAWGKFWSLKFLLLNKSLKHELKIGPCPNGLILYYYISSLNLHATF